MFAVMDFARLTKYLENTGWTFIFCPVHNQKKQKTI